MCTHCHILGLLIFWLRRKSVTFPLRSSRQLRSKRHVQTWKGIPHFLAWNIVTLSSRGPITIPYTAEQVTLVVTASVVPPDTTSYPTEYREVETVEYSWYGPGIEAYYPLLYVAPIESLEWDVGTAVWAHILYSLQAVAPNRPGAQVNMRHFSLILDIAWANPDLSRMLFYKVHPGPHGNIMTGYVLLRKAEILSFFCDHRGPAWEHFRQVTPDSIRKSD